MAVASAKENPRGRYVFIMLWGGGEIGGIDKIDGLIEIKVGKK